MNSGAALVLVAISLVWLALPVAAFVLALLAMGKAGRSERASKNQEKETEALRIRLLKMEQRLARVESADPRIEEKTPAAPPVSTTAPPPRAPQVLAAAVAVPAIALETPDVPGSPILRPETTAPVPSSPAPSLSVPGAPVMPPRPQPPPSPPQRNPREAGPGLEERLGARLPVWIGSVALTLAGAYLVKYSFDKGLLSPSFRVLLGVLFGVVLLGAGGFLRRRSPYVAAGLSASGIADLYACFLAAANLYHLISPVAGFACMAATTALAVVLSLRQGALIAVLGLVGGFFTPVLIQTGETRPGPLFAYLFLLEVGLLAVTRQKRWWPLAGLTLLSASAWAAAWVGLAFEPWHGPYVATYLLASSTALAVFGLWGRQEDERPGAAPSLLIWASVGSGLLIMAALAGVDHYSTLEWLFLGLLGAGCLVLGRMEPAFEGLSWLSALGCAALMVVWGAALTPGDLPRFLWTAAGLGVLFAAGAYACLWGAEKPHRWASLSAAAGLVYLLLAFQGERLVRDETHWGLPALILAGAFAALALPVSSRRRLMPSGDLALSALAVAVTAFVALAVPFELEREWMAVAWSVEVVLLLWASRALSLPALKTVAWPLGALAGARLLLNPAVLTYSTGDLPLFNWILYGYGVPTLAFAAAAWLAHRQEDEMLSSVLQWGTWALVMAQVVLQVRQAFHPGHLDAGNLDLLEAGALTAAVMLYGLILLGSSDRWSLASLEWGGASSPWDSA